ncbi:MAG: ATP-dependent helicase/nuclease subunit A [Bacillota bacterium]|nr:MAG: ATP-dependent helicase/nuclease subunit A [Bacillota bacterium]
MSQWTTSQLRAISARGSNLLVSAGAGAGKTAVLVERIIGLVLDSENPVGVDRLLVVTFTNAAAAEMRERIGAALVARLKEDPANSYLLRQIALLGKASITTLHSFCLELMRQHFYHLSLDPSFRVSDEIESDLIRADVLESLLEKHYFVLDEAFCALIEGFGGRNDDRGVQQLILTIAAYALSQPRPRAWLLEVRQKFDLTDKHSVCQLPWYDEVLAEITQAAEDARSYLQKAQSVALLPAGPGHYGPVLAGELLSIDRIALVSTDGWDDLREAVLGIDFVRLPTKKGGDTALRDVAKLYRDKAKKAVKSLQETYAGQSEEQVLAGLVAAAPQVQKLCDLVEEYFDLYAKAKLAKGLVDFADLEHMALAILDDEGEPSAVALELREKYAEVLVDEYQDINGVQECILGLISRGNNRFMVGDIKQSIYGFRLAEPGVFRAKEEAFLEKPEIGECIHLSENFRSRPAVLCAVNYLFRQLMSGRGVGAVDYGEKAELCPGAVYPEHQATASPHVELALLDRRVVDDEEEADLDVTAREARVVAKKVLELVQGGALNVWDKVLKCYRPAQYRDIVVLLRATSNRADTFIDVFTQLSVPAYADTNSGYFEAIEIMNMLNLLRVIDNPRQDIPLTGVLRSPFVSLSGEELAEVRMAEPRLGYWDAVLAASQLENDIGYKLIAFLTQLNSWRKLARRGGLPELVWQIYEDTGYYLYVGALPGGLARQANLRALYDRACQYESTSFRGLFRFLRFIERLQEQSGDLGTAKTLGENEDVVRVMSIHKSKGLEFPIVFVAGLGNKFNLKDLNQPVLIHKELGLGPQVVDLAARCLYPTLPRLAIRRRLRGESLSEELRVLYVAMTRAREKLYLVGSINKRDEAINTWQEAVQELDDTLLPASMTSSAKCYLDWIGPAYYRHSDLNPQSPYADIDGARFCTLHVQAESGGAGQVALETMAEFQTVASLLPLPDHGYGDVLRQRFNWVYAAQAATTVPAKMSVSELKRKLAVEMDAVPYQSLARQRPSFIRGQQGLTASEIGTAMHMLMQHVDLKETITYDYLTGLRADMLTCNLLTVAEAEAIDLSLINQFFTSALGQRMLRSPKVWRELPFSLRIPANEIYPGVEGEHIFIQGVIDCLFEEGDRVVLVDFKNDKVSASGLQAAADSYRIQLELYTRAIRELLKREVHEAYLYLFAAGVPVRVDVTPARV